MSLSGVFTANLDAENIFLDLTYLPDPILHKFWLTINNQSVNTLYFKIYCNLTNWSLNTPATGELGAIATGVTTTYTPIITRANPAAEATDTGNLTIEAYSDSGYTTLVATASLNVSAYIEDLENWTNTDVTDFSDGTAQGWTLSNFAISNSFAVVAGGYAALKQVQTSSSVVSAGATCTISKSIALPNTNKVRALFYFAWVGQANGSPRIASFSNVSMQVDGSKVGDIPFTLASVQNSSSSLGWVKMAVDLSDFKNQTVTLLMSLQINATSTIFNYPAISIGLVGRIVVAGNN